MALFVGFFDESSGLHSHIFNAIRQTKHGMSSPPQLRRPNLPTQMPTSIRARSRHNTPEHRAHLDEQFRGLLDAVYRLLQSILADPGMNKGSDLVVASILSCSMLATLTDAATISYSEICRMSHLRVGAVRNSLRKLTAAGYFKVIRPSTIDPDFGGMPLKYQAQFEAHSPVGSGRAAA